jgi:4-hydroxy-tetrahydrodipicolinate reductase
MIRIAVVGAAGRMGRAIEAAAQGADGLVVAARVDRSGSFEGTGGAWSEDLGSVLAAGMVVIEFSAPEAAARTAALCAERGAPLVSGSTGLSAAQEAAVREAASRVPVLRASNFSVGVAALRRALAAALAAIPPTWDVEIVERHHRLKKDSPSGTALTLADDVLSARGLGRAALRHGREGAVGARPGSEVGMHSVRGGTWVGDHAVLLAGEGETVELRHIAQDRAAFAHGALQAARFVANAAPGLYGIEALLAGPASAT